VRLLGLAERVWRSESEREEVFLRTGSNRGCDAWTSKRHWERNRVQRAVGVGIETATPAGQHACGHVQ